MFLYLKYLLILLLVRTKMDTLIITLHTQYCIVVSLHSELCKIARWMKREINNNNKVTSLRYVGYIAHRTLLDLMLNYFELLT